MSASEAEFAFEITKRIFLHNKSIKHLTIEWHYDTSMLNVKELRQALERNYTLEHVCFCSKSRPFNATITKLNAAGRRYLMEGGATSKTKCIGVLSNFIDDLDCLFFHLRENPVLFTAESAASKNDTHTGKGN